MDRPETPLPHWYLLGAGAVGTLFAAQLQAAGHPLSVFKRDENDAPDRLSVDLLREATREPPLALEFEIARRRDKAPIQHLLVTTKAYDVVSAVESVAHRLSSDCTVVLLTNGMGLAEQLERALPHLTIVRGTTTQGAYRKTSSQLVHAGEGHTRLGYYGAGHGTEQRPPTPAWFTHWQRAVPYSTWDEDIASALWEKLAVNCVINPLTVLHRCKNGELATLPDAAAAVQRLCREVQQVSYAGGFTRTAQTLPATVAAVIQATAANRSSMLQDVMAGRQTEIEHITGYLVREARRYGIPVPENEHMLESILAL